MEGAAELKVRVLVYRDTESIPLPRQNKNYFSCLFDTERGRELLMNFLMKEFSAENLLFLEANARFEEYGEQTKDGDNIVQQAWIVYRDFIGPNAEKQVNLPSRISTTIRTSLEHKDVSKSLFREAAGAVMELMQKDSLMRFRRTNECRKFIEEVHGNKADFVVRQCNPTLLGLKWLLTRKQIKGTLSFASSSSALQSLAMKKPCMLLTRSPLDNFWAKVFLPTKAVVALAVNAASKKKNVLWAFKELLKKESSLRATELSQAFSDRSMDESCTRIAHICFNCVSLRQTQGFKI